MVNITIHRIEKVEIEKYWLDTDTFVCKLILRNIKKERNQVILFSKSSEIFTDIIQNIVNEN